MKHKTNLGLNNALNSALKLISTKIILNDLIVTMDGDNTHDPRLILKMVEKHNQGDDLVIASRFLKDSDVKGVSKFRIILSQELDYYINYFGGIRI